MSLRTVERAVAGFRQALRAEARATVRFETPPGRQLQIDFGETRVEIGGERVRGLSVRGDAGLFAAVYSFRPSATSASRPGSTASRPRSRTSAGCRGRCCWTTPGRWSSTTTPRRARCGSTSASRPSRGTGASRRGPARPTGRARRARTSGASVTSRATRSPVTPSPAGRRWRRISAGGCARSPTCATTARPARRRSSGSRERGGGLRPIEGRPPFRQVRELIRRVTPDCCVEMDTNAYSVPWRLIGETVQAVVAGGRVSIRHRRQGGCRPCRDDRPPSTRRPLPRTWPASGQRRPGTARRQRARAAAAASGIRAAQREGAGDGR